MIRQQGEESLLILRFKEQYDIIKKSMIEIANIFEIEILKVNDSQVHDS